MIEIWTICPLYGALMGIGEASKGGETGVHVSSLTVNQSTTLNIVSCSTVQGSVNLTVLLVHPCPQEQKQVVKGHGGMLEGREL